MTSATKPHSDPQSSQNVDVIQEWGEESFPAGDPPSSPMTHLGAPRDSAVPKGQARQSRNSQPRPRRPRLERGRP